MKRLTCLNGSHSWRQYESLVVSVNHCQDAQGSGSDTPRVLIDVGLLISLWVIVDLQKINKSLQNTLKEKSNTHINFDAHWCPRIRTGTGTPLHDSLSIQINVLYLCSLSTNKCVDLGIVKCDTTIHTSTVTRTPYMVHYPYYESTGN